MPIPANLEHIVGFIRTDPIFYYDNDCTPICSGENRFKKQMLTAEEEQSMRVILDYAMKVLPGHKVKGSFVRVVCDSFRLTIPDAVKDELLKEERDFDPKAKAEKAERVKREKGASSGEVIVMNSDSEEDVGEVPVYVSRKKGR